jgi:signal transduction histidine kinase
LVGALDSAIDNALRYADSTVEITVTERPDGYEISVADDGRGIPDTELEYIDSGTETPLQHGTGLGLWQLRWAVTTMGGELTFDTDDGTVVSFTVPDLSQ